MLQWLLLLVIVVVIVLLYWLLFTIPILTIPQLFTFLNQPIVIACWGGLDTLIIATVFIDRSIYSFGFIFSYSLIVVVTIWFPHCSWPTFISIHYSYLNIIPLELTDCSPIGDVIFRSYSLFITRYLQVFLPPPPTTGSHLFPTRPQSYTVVIPHDSIHTISDYSWILRCPWRVVTICWWMMTDDIVDWPDGKAIIPSLMTSYPILTLTPNWHWQPEQEALLLGRWPPLPTVEVNSEPWGLPTLVWPVGVREVLLLLRPLTHWPPWWPSDPSPLYWPHWRKLSCVWGGIGRSCVCVWLYYYQCDRVLK